MHRDVFIKRKKPQMFWRNIGFIKIDKTFYFTKSCFTDCVVVKLHYILNKGIWSIICGYKIIIFRVIC